jgi:sporulation protein YlmC with PRC-barrel domain
VLAQTSPSTTAPAPAGSTTAPATTTQGSQMSQGSSMQSGSIQYITQSKADMWRASKLEGVNVYNQNNERIGEVDDVLVDKQGKVEAVVIGVGGFLGIGERRVAVPFNALQWQMEDKATARAGTATTAPPATATAPSTTAPSTTGTVATSRPAADVDDDDMEAPERAILANATKDQLKEAPEFKYSR